MIGVEGERILENDCTFSRAWANSRMLFSVLRECKAKEDLAGAKAKCLERKSTTKFIIVYFKIKKLTSFNR